MSEEILELGRDAVGAVRFFLRFVVWVLIAIVIVCVSAALGLGAAVAVLGFMFGLW